MIASMKGDGFVKQENLKVYDQRYQLIYESGIQFWNQHEPPTQLLHLVEGLAEGDKCIEFGCGEGHESRVLASKGLHVTAIDLSPTVIKHAINNTHKDLDVNYLVGDVTDLTNLGIVDHTYELAVNVGCLHMMAEDEDRIAHLKEVKRVLKSGGLFFLQNGLALDSVVPMSTEEKHILEQLQSFQKQQLKPGELISMQVSTPEGIKKVEVPLCPPGKTLSIQEYVTELEAAGFSILFTEQGGGANMPFEAIIVVRA